MNSFASSLLLPSLLQLLAPDFSGKFLPVPLMRQARDHTCGASAIQGMLAYYGEDFREGQLEKILQSNPLEGTNVGRIAAFLDAMADPEAQRRFRKSKGNGEETVGRQLELPFLRYRYRAFGKAERFDGGPPAADCPAAALPGGAPPVALDGDGGWETVREEIDRGHPVLVALQAWGRGPGDYNFHRWDSGHYAVVVGYDADRVYFMDPSTTGNYAYVAKEEFFSRWYDFEGDLSKAGERCPGGLSYYRLGLSLWTENGSIYRWPAVVPME